MAELILTEKEKADETYLQWDDAALGRLVRMSALKIRDAYGRDAAFGVTGAHLLIAMSAKVNATRSEYTLKGVTSKDGDLGDWKVTVEKLG